MICGRAAGGVRNAGNRSRLSSQHEAASGGVPCLPLLSSWLPRSLCEQSGRLAGRVVTERAGTRTQDLRIKSPLLYQLSYALRIASFSRISRIRLIPSDLRPTV